MFDSVTPQSLLQRQVSVLQDHVPAVLDGAAVGVHDARVNGTGPRSLITCTRGFALLAAR